MSLFNHNINNLSGGVSQQNEDARYDNQVEEMENFVPTVAQGLTRRNPLQTVATLSTDLSQNMAIHSYSRGDDVEKYGMILNDDGLKVFDTDGTEKTVVDISSAGEEILTKWAGTDWSKDIRFLTVGDTTWVLNTSMTVLPSATLTPIDANANSAFYWVKKSFNDGTSGAGHGYSYEIDLTDLSPAIYNHTSSIDAAELLATAIDGLGGYTSRNEGSIVYVSRATDFEIVSGDSWGNQASIAWKDSVAKISDLPATMEGFTDAEVGTVAITGTDKDNFTNYYLKWDTDHWTETVKEGIEFQIDYKTMPAKLVRQSDGTFALGWNLENSSYDGFNNIWGERDKGDDDSNPMPSFMNNKLSNMFFFKNRLGFTSEENVILSQTGSYYDFFATTVIEILDTDPIDAAADSNNISIIRAVNVTAGAITLWTDTAQFMLSGGETLSPSTTRISQTSSYVASLDAQPKNVDNEILFFNKSGSYLEVFTYAPSSLNNDKSTAASLSAHIPEYLPSDIIDVEVAQGQNLVFMLSPSSNTKIYVYKYHVANNERVMSAWFEFTFAETIRKINVLEDKLFILANTYDLFVMDLDVKSIGDTFLDKGTDSYTSRVKLSKFNIQTSQNTQQIREKFFIKTILSKVDGSVDVNIVNEERGTSKTTDTKHVSLRRKIIVGGDSDKVKVEYTTTYDTGCSINVLNVEGSSKVRSRNKD